MRSSSRRGGALTPGSGAAAPHPSGAVQRRVARRAAPSRHAAGKRAALDDAAASRALQLRYVTDHEPGLRRIRHAGRFRYVDSRGNPVRDAETLLRIRSLAIPPAYEDVWICATADGHLQATARDARGRKQYRYHPLWRALRDANKFERMIAFGRVLPEVRERVSADLRGASLSRERVLATVVSLLEQTLVRVGNEEYARENGSFGLTTLREDHVQVRSQSIRFLFRGKSGVPHDVTVQDRRLIRVVRRCLDIPGQELFRFIGEDKEPHVIGSADVNAYIRAISGADFTAKDFRTWSASVLALEALAQRPHESTTQAKREVVAAVKAVAERLGNTPAVCRKCYIHPAVIDTYLESGPDGFPAGPDAPVPGLAPAEARLLALLEQRAGRRLPVVLLPQALPLDEALAILPMKEGEAAAGARRAA